MTSNELNLPITVLNSYVGSLKLKKIVYGDVFACFFSSKHRPLLNLYSISMCNRFIHSFFQCVHEYIHVLSAFQVWLLD